MPALTLAALVAVIRRPPRLCGIEDDHPSPLPCHHEATTPLQFHCVEHGPCLRYVCPGHAATVTGRDATCGLCAEAGHPGVPVQPQPATSKENRP